MFLKRILIGCLSLLLILFIACSKQLTEEQIMEKAQEIHNKAITLDTHVDISSQYATEQVDPGIDNPRLKCDLVKMKEGGMDGVFLAVFVGQRDDFTEEGYKNAYDVAITKFEAIHRLTESMYPDRCELAVTPDEVEQIAQTEERAIMIGIENGYPVGEDLSLLTEFYNRGARYITLCHSGHNQICDSSGPDAPKHNGLSEFGKKVVAKMNRLGIMIDVSHISAESFWDVIETTKAPIIASHSGCKAVNEHNRNLDDEQLRALSENGGVIQVIALSSFLKTETPEHREAVENLRQEMELPGRRELYRMSREEQEALRPKFEEFQRRLEEIEKEIPGTNIQDYMDHIDHAVKIAGIDHVGIGTDFDGGGGIPGFNDHSEALNVTIELIKRGYSDDDIKKIWGGNLLRVWQEVEEKAKELQDAD